MMANRESRIGDSFLAPGRITILNATTPLFTLIAERRGFRRSAIT